MASELRTRAAYLHIAKCAGTSVTGALTAAAGHPVQPEARLDSCYTYSAVDRSEQGEVAQRMMLDPAEINPDRPPGTHVFETHWSLPTLRTWFAPDDIATVLREPAMRLLSFVLFAHTRTQAQRRIWYPDDIGARMIRRPLAELLRWEPAARANDNLAVRQLLWGDERIVGDEFLQAEDVDALATQASRALDEFGFVGVIEAADDAVDGLGRWLGRPLDVGHSNRTVDVPYTGLITSSTDLDDVQQLLSDRTAADRVVWARSARRFGIDPDDASFERAVGERLARLSTSSSFALWSDTSTEPAALQRSVVVVGGNGETVEPSLAGLGGETHSTHVHEANPDVRAQQPSTPAGVPGVLFDRSVTVESLASVDLRALLAGYDFDLAIVCANDRNDLALTTRQLADAVVPGGSIAILDAPPAVDGVVDSQFWDRTDDGAFVRTDVIAPVESMAPTAPSLEAATMGTMDTTDTSKEATEATEDWSRYGEEILLDNPTDSRAIVLGLLDGEPQRILELGCSAGLMTRVLRERGHRITGVEIDPVAAELCRPFTERVIVGDLDVTGAEDLLNELEPSSHDVLLAADVLEHVRNPLGALRRALASLTPDGQVILSIPNIAHGDVRLALLAGQFDYRSNGLLDRTHVQMFTLASLTEMIRDAGLVPVSWLRSSRPVGTTEVVVDETLFEFGQRAFAGDPEVDTYQWIVTCRRADDPAAVADWPAAADSVVAANVAPMLDVVVPQPQPSTRTAVDAGAEDDGSVDSTLRSALDSLRPLVGRGRRLAGRIVRALKG